MQLDLSQAEPGTEVQLGFFGSKECAFLRTPGSAQVVIAIVSVLVERSYTRLQVLLVVYYKFYKVVSFSLLTKSGYFNDL